MENALLLIGFLFIISVFFSKVSDKYGIPALLFFLAVGMLAGSDGVLKIPFDNVKIAGDIGTIALIYILFAGGLDTNIKAIAPIYKAGLVLATLGVIITALILGAFVYFLLNFSFLESLLLASIISSTDAAAVFAILRSKNIKLKNNIGELLEFESGSNDPMAIFLTMTLISFMTMPTTPSATEWIVDLLLQFGLGGLLGYLAGIGLPILMNKIRLSVWGLYPVLMLSIVVFLFGICTKIGGNGYIAVYIAGIFANKKDFVHKKNLVGFFDGIAWLMQVFIFLTLGLLVYPTELPSVAIISLMLSIFLMFVARPISVFIGLIFTKFKIKEKSFISWVGFRGVVPIILATYPLAHGIENGQTIFNIVFFMVLISVLLQGATLGKMAVWLDIKAPLAEPISPTAGKPIFYSGIRQFSVPEKSKFIGHNLAEAEFSKDFLIVLIKRGDNFFKPTGSYDFEEGDVVLVYCKDEDLYNSILKEFDERVA